MLKRDVFSDTTRLNLPFSHASELIAQSGGVIRTRSLVIPRGNQGDGYCGEGRNKRWHYELIRYRAGMVLDGHGEKACLQLFSWQERYEPSVYTCTKKIDISAD